MAAFVLAPLPLLARCRHSSVMSRRSCFLRAQFPGLQDWPHIPYGSGSVDITLGTTSGLVGVSAAATADGHLQLTTTSATVTIGSVNLSFHGSLWDWLIDLFKGAFALRRARRGAILQHGPPFATAQSLSL